MAAGAVLRSVKCRAAVTLLAVMAAPALFAQSSTQNSNPGSSPDSKLQAQVGYLMDRQSITDTMQRYIRGIDRHDKALARSAFWPEARINMGSAPNGREEYIDREEAALAAYGSHQHHITGQTVDLQGNTAHVETYVFFFALPRDTSVGASAVAPTAPGRVKAGEKTQIGSGRYIERWEKRNGEWKILVREYVHDLSVDAEAVDYCSKRPCLTRWDHEDLSYMRPLQPQSTEQRRARADATQKLRAPSR